MVTILLSCIGFVSAVEPDPIDYNHMNNSNYDTVRNITSPGMYYLTENISSTNGIIISSDNVTLDGQGYFLNITGDYGVNSTYHNNITVKNVKITTTSYSGIYFKNVNFPTVENNTINTTYLCSLWGSGYNFTVVNNSMSSGFGGNYGLEQLTTYTVVGNTLNGKPIYFYKDTENIGEIPSDAAQIIISNCTNGQIKNLTLDENAVVIYIGDSSEITVENCTIKPNIYEEYALYLINSESCSITNNTFGISENTDFGVIRSHYSNNITISGNTLNEMAVGFRLYGITNSSIFENTFENIAGPTIVEEGSVSEVYVYLNNFINCPIVLVTNITFNSPTNVSYAYNGTVYSGIAGNYWSDYNETNATINDGIWSIPHTIMELVNDSYPLVEPANPETKEETPNDGLIHLTQDDFTDNETGYIASESGTYVLDENITCAMGIGINASNITIDGNGFYLTGNVSERSEYWEDTGIYALSGNFENITVKNVVITEWYYGIAVPLHWEDYEITNFSVINCTFLNNDWMGIGEMYVFGGEITNSTFKNSYYGVMLPYTENIIITGNEFSGNEYGLYAGGVNNWIYLNKFENNSQNIDFRSLSGNYFHSPVVKYEYNGKVYEGRVGNYYGEELGTSNAGIYDKPYGIEAMIRK
ncbi:NosD domain-containing protein [Methanococcus maripaludis]|nr:NosD domain-containing protein [Methanococcus maripaludis]MBA2863926.1 hypothetical protein [Methanococcus maripaludis]